MNQGHMSKIDLLRDVLATTVPDPLFQEQFGEAALERIKYFIERMTVTHSGCSQEGAYQEMVSFIASRLGSLQKNVDARDLGVEIRREIHGYVEQLRGATLTSDLRSAYAQLVKTLGNRVARAVMARQSQLPAWRGNVSTAACAAAMLDDPSQPREEMPEYMRTEQYDTPPVVEDTGALLRENRELRLRIDALEAARRAYASEFPLTADGEPDVGNIHANIRRLKQVAGMK